MSKSSSHPSWQEGAEKGHIEGSESSRSLGTHGSTPLPADHFVDYKKHFFAIHGYGSEERKGKRGRKRKNTKKGESKEGGREGMEKGKEKNRKKGRKKKAFLSIREEIIENSGSFLKIIVFCL